MVVFSSFFFCTLLYTVWAARGLKINKWTRFAGNQVFGLGYQTLAGGGGLFTITTNTLGRYYLIWLLDLGQVYAPLVTCIFFHHTTARLCQLFRT